MKASERDRRAALADFRRRYHAIFGRMIDDSGARACFRGECSTEEYRLAYKVQKEWGLE